MGIVEIIALSMGLAWASGINLYAAIAMLGLLGASGNMALPPGLEVLADPAVIMAAGFMYCVEFFADKTPGVDTTWDTIHSFIRIPAGAVLAATALGQVSPEAQIAAAIIGGGLAATSHGMKTGSRILINTSPEPFTNWTASVAEDVIVIGGLFIAIYQPAVFLVLLVVFIALAIWLMPKLWRAIKTVFARIRGALGGKKPEASTETADPKPSASTMFNPSAISGQSSLELGHDPK